MTKDKSTFSLSDEHKQMLRERAKEEHRPMTSHLEVLIEEDYRSTKQYERHMNLEREG